MYCTYSTTCIYVYTHKYSTVHVVVGFVPTRLCEMYYICILIPIFCSIFVCTVFDRFFFQISFTNESSFLRFAEKANFAGVDFRQPQQDQYSVMFHVQVFYGQNEYNVHFVQDFPILFGAFISILVQVAQQIKIVCLLLTVPIFCVLYFFMYELP